MVFISSFEVKTYKDLQNVIEKFNDIKSSYGYQLAYGLWRHLKFSKILKDDSVNG